MADLTSIFTKWADRGFSALLKRLEKHPSSSAQHSAEKDLRRMMRLLPRIQAVLADAEEREVRDESVRLWLRELRDLSYGVDDIVDEYEYDLLRAQVESRAASEVSRKRMRGHGEDPMTEKIREITERFEEIEKDREALRFREEDGERRFNEKVNTRALTSSHVDESSIYGREQDLEKVVEILLTETSCVQYSVTVIPITGMGGVGKTTLAQLVYNDPRVCQHFDCKGWVCVSEDFDVVKLTKEMYKSLIKKSCEDTGLSNLQDSLRRKLSGKRSLIVLDDVWNEKQNLWESLRAPLHSTGMINIVMTTRNEGVADVMRTVPSFHLNFLSEEKSWLLFKHCAFDVEDSDDSHDNIVKIGKQIVKKCGGLPLAVKLLGSHLRFERNEERWMDILESDLWELDQVADEVLPALKLSYQRMPAFLKPCFRYCSLFPKDTKLVKDNLIKMWMAQGYIQAKASKTLEDTGREYMEELLRRSFFQPVEWCDDLFVIHDMVVDLARTVSGEEFGILKLNDRMKMCSISNEVKHLTVYNELTSQSGTWEELFLCNHTTLRTLLYHCNNIANALQFTNLMHLRVFTLEIHHENVLNFLDSIGCLKHLRYLRICKRYKVYGQHGRLPNSLGHNYNLQTLDLLRYGDHIEHLSCIGNLFNLRHLLLPHQSFLPQNIGNLTSLQSLRYVTVKNGRSHCRRIGDIKNLIGLKGSFSISRLNEVVDPEDLSEASLRHKQHIDVLHLYWGIGTVDTDITFEANEEAREPGQKEELAEAVLEALKPHNNLRKLKINDYPGARFPTWIGHPSYFKLREIMLDGYGDACKILPTLAQLPSLRKLKIWSFGGIHSIGHEFVCGDLVENSNATSTDRVGFPLLEELELADLPEWEEWYGVLGGDFPNLRNLTIKYCCKLKKIANLMFFSLKSFDLMYCRKLKWLPGLQSMHSLEKLNIKGCHEICISAQERLPSKLQYIHISDCWKLNSIPSLQNLSSLKSLELEKCPRLEHLGNLHLLCMSQNVRIADCVRLREWCTLQQFDYIQKLSAIKELTIRSTDEITSEIGVENLVSLENLHLRGSLETHLPPNEWFPSTLKTIQISFCENLEVFPEYPNISTLRQIKLWKCKKLSSIFGLQNCEFIENLEVKDCPELVFSLHQKLPSKLQFLNISNCMKITSLPGLQQLASLKSLVLCGCPKLHLSCNEQLPSMPQYVKISNCPWLKEWCEMHKFDYFEESSEGSI